MRNKKWFKLNIMAIAFMFIFNCIPSSALTAYANDTKASIRTVIDDTKTTGEINYFTYYGNGWVAGGSGSSSEHYNVLSNGEENPEQKYYTVDFIGNRIEVYGNKTAQNGKTKYSLYDAEGNLVANSEVIIDGRVDNTSPAYAWGGLTEGKYTLKAEATGVNSNSAHAQAVIQVDRVEILHEKYEVTSIELGEDVSLVEGAKKQLTVAVNPIHATADDIIYISDNEEVATVSETGVITAVATGSATITATSEEFNVSDSIMVTVTEANASMYGTIVDTNSHYTQDRYDEVLTLGSINESLYAWKADKAISEIVVASKEGILKNVTVSASDFISGSNVINSENIITTFLKETKAYIGDAGYHASSDGPANTPSDDSEKVSVPDVLYTEGPVNVEFNALQPIWVEINVPENATSGVYEGTVTVTADGVDDMVFNYALEVLDVTMPSSSEYEFDFEAWQYPYSSAEYYGVEPFSEEHLAILTPHMLKYKELGGHAITASIVEEAWGGQTYSENEIRYPSMIKWTRNADGTFSFDYTDFDKWVQFNKDLGIGDKIVCYSMIPWGNNVKYYDEASGTTMVENLPAGTTRYEEVWLQFLNKLVIHLDEKGWFDDTYIGIDERSNMDKAFDVIDKVKNRHDKVLKKAAAMDHFSTSYKYITDRVDDLSVGSTAAKGSLADYKNFVAERAEAEKEYKTTIYTCTEHFPNSLALSMPGESYWTMMFTAAQGATGYMRWAFDAWVQDPLRDTTHWAFEAGDTFLIYPDEKDSENITSKTSVRLEKMAEGIRDVNKLYMMQNEVPSLKADIDNLLATVKLNYTGTKNGVGDHGGAKYATDETRAMIPDDMAAIKAEIKNITEKYIELRDGGVNTIDSVEINNGNQEMNLGEKLSLNVTVMPENALNKEVIWTSSNTSVATVNSQGVVTGVKVGTVQITATSAQDSSKKSTINLVVNKKAIEEEAKVAYYSFDNIDGNVVENVWGDGSLYNGTINGPVVVEGKSGNALNFIAGTNNVEIESPANLPENWTIAFWVNRGNEEGTASVMWDGRTATGSSELNSVSVDLAVGVGANASKPGVHVNQGTLSFPTEIAKNQWLHVAYTNSVAEGLALYVNGEKIGTTNAYTKNNPMKAPLEFIGGRGFVGQLDELKVYNRALTAEEIIEAKAVNGLNVDTNYKEIYINESVQIIAELISDKAEDNIIFTSDNENIATVSENGLVTGVAYGDTFITVSNESGEYSETVDIRVNRRINYQNTLETYEIPAEEQIVIDREDGQYLGQPDTILLDDDKTLLTVYPKGHGFGEALLSKSTDGGLTWEKRVPVNETWVNSEETPTIYKLDFVDGSQKLISISGGPEWHGSTFRGFKTSISDDNGETWGDYTEWNTGIRTIVAMASLIQLKDENGNYIDKWMGVFHDYGYVNYKTYLTFDENGQEQWSDPEPYLSEYRTLESTYQICEVGMFRSPDGNRIVALARSQSHKHTSTIFYSDDEGETWSRPREVQGSLNGERHKAVYDPISGRLLISFREIKLDTNLDGNTSDGDWMAGDWIGWVGTYEDLMNGNDGEYRIRLAKDYTNSAKAGDTGYAGSVVMSDGTFFLNSYGNFDTNTNNNTYIIGLRFKLGEIDNALGKVNRESLKVLLEEVEGLNGELYTEESYSVLMNVYNEAREIYEDNSSAQAQIDSIVVELNAAKENLKEADVTPEPEVNKELLKSTIDYAQSVKEQGALEGLVPVVVKEFNSSLEQAQEIYANVKATEAEVEAACNRLLQAIWMLEFEVGDKDALKAIIDIAEALVEGDYTSESWSKLQSALVSAGKVYEDENALVEEVNKAIADLQEAIDGLVKNNVNKDVLQNLINMINGLSDKEDQYIELTWANLKAELTGALVVLENENSTQEEVDSAYNKLMRAYLQLRLKPSKDLLEDLLNKVNELDSSKYTVATWRSVEEAVERASKILEDSSATEKEIVEAEEELRVAISNLKEVSVSDNSSNSNNSSNNSASGNTNNGGASTNSGKLPQTGGTSALMVVLVGAIIAGAGFFMFKKKKTN